MRQAGLSAFLRRLYLAAAELHWGVVLALLAGHMGSSWLALRWAGEADLRVKGGKMKLTTIPAAEWATVEAEAQKFWDEVATTSPRCAKVVKIFRDYNELMSKAGPPYRYT